MIHELKIKSKYFKPVIDGLKRFELRKMDRDYKVGDTLWLREVADGAGGTQYTGNETLMFITYILPLDGTVYGSVINHDYAILSVVPADIVISDESKPFLIGGKNNE